MGVMLPYSKSGVFFPFSIPADAWALISKDEGELKAEIVSFHGFIFKGLNLKGRVEIGADKINL